MDSLRKIHQYKTQHLIVSLISYLIFQFLQIKQLVTKIYQSTHYYLLLYYKHVTAMQHHI